MKACHGYKRREMRILIFPMGCFSGAGVCELVGSYILQQLSQHFEHHSAGLYRYDGLAILKSLSGPETERIKEKVIK